MLTRLSTACIHLKSRSSPLLFRVGSQSRSLHISTKNANLTKNRRFVLDSVSLVRFASTSPIKDLPPIPEAPPIPAFPETTTSSVTETVVNQLAANGEPTFASIGLGGWTPKGIVENCMEYLHCTLDIPWWGAIAIATIVVRSVIFPLVIIQQRNNAVMHNNMPQMQALQLKMTEARQTGNQYEAARYSQEMMLFMKEKGCNPLKNMIVPLVQMPIFLSVFFAFREMANTPVYSMTTGGLAWFTDLTMPDPFYILPIVTSATLAATIELGADFSQAQMQTMKYVIRCMPLAVLAFTFNFPAAMLWYWTLTNFITLAQVGFLKVPAVRQYFKIQPLQKFNPESLPMKKKGFVAGVKDSWTNMKITNEMENRKRVDEIKFARAGKGALVKTYKYDPTKPKPAVAAKKS
ncbi:mitochondrial inner membrane protein OXA1L [Culicoides brevitarsis]|uniref:mitochondrial inner membrane protein OXA1L n=1 Tax=Culicoides brevitarsis TaxID=469753 RepID=UPI00307C52CD